MTNEDHAEQHDNRTDIEKYVAEIEKTIKDDHAILIISLKNESTTPQSICLEPECNIEYLEPGAIFEVVLLINKADPKIDLRMMHGHLTILPHRYGGAIFQDGKGIMNY